MKFIAYPVLTMMTLAASLSSANELPLATARKIATRALSYAGKRSFKVSVAIVNAEGGLLLFERGDGSYPGSIEVSQQKAQSANAFQRPTSAFVQAVQSGRTGLLTGKGIVAIEGGVPIVVNGKHVGAIGVSGARALEDEEVANDAIKALAE